MKPDAISAALALVAPAEQAFTSRWRLSTLARVDPGLHQLLQEQRDLYDSALLKGSDTDVREQSQAMVRGWRAACQRMEAPLMEDDAYLVGSNLDTFTTVIIGHHKGSAGRQQVKDGHTVIFVTPDEVASLFAGMTALRQVKALFPDAEIMGLTQ